MLPVIRFAARIAVLAALPLAALAQPYPSKPIELVVPYPPGGTVETMARIVADKLTKSLGQPVLVVTRPGAAGNIGSASVAKAKPDGYALVLGTQSSHGTNWDLFKNMPYNPITDFAPITNIASSPLVLVVNPKLPVKSVAELVAYAKGTPDKRNYASTSVGGLAHLSGEMFKRATGLDLTHVPYKGSGPAKTDLIGGHVMMMFDNTASALPAVSGGQLRALAITSPARNKAAPALPTMIESGFPDFVAEGWYGLFAPANTPADVVDRLHREMVALLKLPDVVERFNTLGLDIIANTPKEFAAQMKADMARLGKVIKDAGITAE